MQHRSPKGHQVGQWCSGRRRAAPMGAGVGSAWVAPGEQMPPEHPLQLPWGRFCRVLLVFRARGAAGAVPPPSSGSEPPPAAFHAAVKAERERKGGKEYEEGSLHSTENDVCILLSAQTLLLSSQPEKHLRFVVPASPPANRCLAIAVCPCSRGFLLRRSCADEPRCEMVPVLSSTSGRRTLLCNFPTLYLNASLPGPFSGLH